MGGGRKRNKASVCDVLETPVSLLAGGLSDRIHGLSLKTSIRPFTASTLSLTIVVCAHLESLVSPHHQPDLCRLLVLQETHVSSSSLLPLLGLLLESEQLSSPVELGLA